MADMNTVTAAIVIENNRVLIAKRKQGDTLAHKWEFPGGSVEEGETPEQCLIREMKEEFEIDVTVGDLLGDVFYHYEHGSINLLAYRAYWKGGDIRSKAHDDYKWAELETLRQFDFAPADIPFVEKLSNGEIKL